MGVRKTESRIPAGLQPSDLGEAVASVDGNAYLISYITSPLTVNRDNAYVVLIPDDTLAAVADTYRWTFAEEGQPLVTKITDAGVISYSPSVVGNIDLEVSVLDTNGTQKTSLTFSQIIAGPNSELEELIAEAANEQDAGQGNPDVTRELVNDHNPYYQNVALKTPEAGEAFQDFVFSMVYIGAMEVRPEIRKQELEQLAASINGDDEDFVTQSAKGMGVCKLRLVLLAMNLPDMLDWTELPENSGQRTVTEEKLRQSLALLDENKLIDLFNLVRFPKANVTMCARIIENLRDHYFAGTSFSDVVSGMSGTREHWIRKHYQLGPLKIS
jgi:hypothetical protein